MGILIDPGMNTRFLGDFMLAEVMHAVASSEREREIDRESERERERQREREREQIQKYCIVFQLHSKLPEDLSEDLGSWRRCGQRIGQTRVFHYFPFSSQCTIPSSLARPLPQDERFSKMVHTMIIAVCCY